MIFNRPWGRYFLNKVFERSQITFVRIVLSTGDFILSDIGLPSIFKSRKGFTRIPNLIFQRILTATEFRVIAVICYHLPNAFPSIERISSIASISRRQAVRILNQLEKKGLILKHKETGKSTVYHVLSKEKAGG